MFFFGEAEADKPAKMLRVRSLTTAGITLTPMRRGSLLGELPLYDLNDSTEPTDLATPISQDFASLPNVGAVAAIPAFETLLGTFEQLPVKSIFSGTTPILQDFKTAIGSVISGAHISYIYGHWPPELPREPKVQTMALYIRELIKRCAQPKNVLMWATATIGDPKLLVKAPPSANHITALFLGRKRRRIGRDNHFYWITLTPGGGHAFQISKGALKPIWSGPVASFTMKNRKVKLLGDKKQKLKSFSLIDPRQINLWQQSGGSLERLPPLPMLLSMVEKPYPDDLLQSFYDDITSDDMLFVRALPHAGPGSTEKDGLALASAMLDVFAHAGKVNQLLVALASIDFGSDSVDATNICRENSSLTNMFKVFFQRYGRPYYEQVIRPIIDQIDDLGDLGLLAPKESDSDKIGGIMFGALDAIVAGLPHIRPEIHHMASILKMFSAIRFNTRRATYNTLSLFFFTRYVTAIFANPPTYDEAFKPKSDPRAFLIKITIPFSQMMQTPFNRLTMTKKYEPLQSLNDKLTNVYFAKLSDFLLQVADTPKEPVAYPPPSKEQLNTSLNYILDRAIKSYDQLAAKYSETLANPTRYTPVAWSVGSYFLQFFREGLQPQP
jgi:hypothetical protein